MDEKRNNELIPRRTKSGAETAKTSRPTLSEAFKEIRAELNEPKTTNTDEPEPETKSDPTENTLSTIEGTVKTIKDTSSHPQWTEQISLDNDFEYEKEKSDSDIYETTTSESDQEVVIQPSTPDIRATKDWQGPNKRRDLGKCGYCGAWM